MTDTTTDTRMFIDQGGSVIPALAPSTIANAAVGAGSTATALPAGSDFVEVSTTTDAYILFGTSGVTAASTTSMAFPKGSAVYRVPTGATHLGHIQVDTAGRISITKLV